MNYALLGDHHVHIGQGYAQKVGVKCEMSKKKKKTKLTLIKFRNWCLALHLKLTFSVFLVRVVSLDMVPGIELKDIVPLAQIAASKLEGIGPF